MNEPQINNMFTMFWDQKMAHFNSFEYKHA